MDNRNQNINRDNATAGVQAGPIVPVQRHSESGNRLVPVAPASSPAVQKNAGQSLVHIEPEETKKKGGKGVLRAVVFFAVILLAAISIYCLMWYNNHCTKENGVMVVELYEYDLTDEQKDKLRETFGDVEFRWNIDLGGTVADSTATELVVSASDGTTSEQIISAVEQMPNLEQIDLTGTSITTDDYDKIFNINPEAEIEWNVPTDSGDIYYKTTELTPGSLEEYQDIIGVVKYLPELEKIDVSYVTLTETQQEALQNDAEMLDVEIVWMVDVCGVRVENDTESLEIFGGDFSDLSQLAALPKLREITLRGEGQTVDLSPLVNMPNIMQINVYGCKIADVTVLYEMTWLQSVIFKNTNVSAAQAKRLSDALPGCYVINT